LWCDVHGCVSLNGLSLRLGRLNHILLILIWIVLVMLLVKGRK
jgi:hypothetical protein